MPKLDLRAITKAATKRETENQRRAKAYVNNVLIPELRKTAEAGQRHYHAYCETIPLWRIKEALEELVECDVSYFNKNTLLITWFEPK